MQNKLELIKQRLPVFKEILKSCRLCPRKCGVNRLDGQKGFCRTGSELKLASWAQHRGEEPPISGKNGSGAIFSSACYLGCCFCQNFPFSQLDNGKIVTAEELGKIYNELAKKGVHNINWVTPAHVLPMLLEGFLYADEKALSLPIVYNCSGYESEEIIDLLDGIVDIYLPDIKYSDDRIALDLSKCPNYVDINRKALKKIAAQVGNLQIDPETELATRGYVIRHLILPDNLAGSEASLKWIARELGKDTFISIMCQYFPAYKAHTHPLLNRAITMDEYEPVLELVEKIGFENVWAQDPEDPGGA